MSTEQLPETTPPIPPSTPDAPAATWSRRKTLTAVAVAVVVAGAGGGTIWAVNGSADAATTTGGTTAPGGQGMGGAPQGSAALSAALHGEYVASDGNGGYTTELMQVGKVTELSATSVTALSDDGFSQTYTIDAATATADASALATGDTVTIVATTSGDTATADTITEGATHAGGQPGQAGQARPAVPAG
jgi:hypothetical protein